MKNKYDTLNSHLRNLPAERSHVTLSFAELEVLLNAPLPESAKTHRAWWSNQTDTSKRPQANAWTSAGFQVEEVRQSTGDCWVRWRRIREPALLGSSDQRPADEVDAERISRSETNPLREIHFGSLPETYPRGTVFLVSCVSEKRSLPSPAKDLYVSDWFRKARAFVEATGHPWFILSAEWGLLPPDVEVAPYERTLNTMALTARREWAKRVGMQLSAALPSAERIVFFAGMRYREILMPLLSKIAHTVEVPLEGMRIGEQLSWFKRHTPHVPTE